MIEPSQIPQFTGDLAALETAVTGLGKDAGAVRKTGADVHAQFQGLAAYYTAPEAEQLFATTHPVKTRADGFGDDLENVGRALSDYAAEVKPIAAKLAQLKVDAQAFVDSVADDDEWKYDGDKIEEHNGLQADVTAAVAAFWEAERACANKITALFGGTQFVANDGSNKENMYGYAADDLEQAKVPWGTPEEESHHWYEVGHWVKSFVWDGLIVDGIWGTIKGLGTLVGFQGLDAMGQAWKGLAQLATGLVLMSVPVVGAAYMAAPDDKLPSWLRDSRTAVKETGKALVAWDQWGKNPARAAGAVTFNVVTTVFTGGAGAAASGAGKAGAVAKTLSALSKAGKTIDPMTYIAKGAGAGLSKIGDVMAGLKGVGNIDIPALPDTMVRLPEGSVRLPDGSFTLPEGAVIPEGAVTTPTGALKLPEGWTTVSHDSVALPDGRVMEPDGSLLSPNGAVDPTPIPAEKLPEQTPAQTSVQPPVQQPVLAGVHTGDGLPPVASTVDGLPPHGAGADIPPHGSGPDLPTGPGSHADDGAHIGDESAGYGDDAVSHGDDAASHGDDGVSHSDDATPAANPDHTAPADGTGAADDAARAGDEADGPGGHDSGPADGGFTYEPSMTEAEFSRLTPEEQHRVAAAEINEGAVSFPDGDAAIAYGRDHWNQYVDDLDPSAKQALWDYTGDTPPSYIDMNGYLRGDASYDTPAVRHDIAEIDKVMAGKPVPEDIMVVRGTGLGHLNLSSYDDMIGNTYPDKGYFSTSLGNNPVASFSGKEAVLHLRVPEGTPALWVEKVSKYDVTERELLLGRGSSYRVTRVFMDDKGQVQVYGEVLPR